MAEFDFFLERNAAQKIDERIAQSRRNRLPARRKRNRHFLRRHR